MYNIYKYLLEEMYLVKLVKNVSSLDFAFTQFFVQFYAQFFQQFLNNFFAQLFALIVK